MSEPPSRTPAETQVDLQALPDDVPTLQAMVRSLVAAVQVLQAEVATLREQCVFRPI